jgi:hypothetical protein
MLRDKQQHAPFRDVAFSSRFACSKRWRELSSEREQLTPSADPPRGRGRLTCRPKTDRPLSARRSAAAPPQGWRTFDLCSEETPCKPQRRNNEKEGTTAIFYRLYRTHKVVLVVRQPLRILLMLCYKPDKYILFDFVPLPPVRF